MARRNDDDRAQWVENDEGLYNWKREWIRQNPGKGGLRGFIRAHREEIDQAIDSVLGGDKPAHHLEYGPGARRDRPLF